ncbi:MAG TPA: VOC family protein [Polyangiaceae bacterium]|nr:VOC family protein [Polyangiaceae bacterium]
MAKKSKKVKPIPKGYRSVTPSLNVNDVKSLIKFCEKAFDAETRTLVPGAQGKVMHAEILIGDSLVMLSDAVQEPARPGNLFLYVEKVDKTFAKAVKAGAKVVTPIEDTFWGDRWGRVEDPLGNRWAIATRVEEVSAKKLKKRMAEQKPADANAGS